MIQELQIKNFRNISSLNLTFKDLVTIIKGKNDLGKSNALNAACWLTTGTILTDKWGYGENDIDSIIPKGVTRGVNPEVSVIIETGTKFTKKYISQWSKDGSKIKGHTTEWYINDVACKNETEFNEQFYLAFNYKPSLKTKDVNELRLFTDPLYALQKLDAKQLRALLVDLGCSVSAEELYQQGFGDLRPYGDKYLGKWDVMRKNLKDEIKTLTKDIESLQAKLETVASIEEYDEATLKALAKEYEDLVAKRAALQHNEANPDIVEYEKQLEALKAAIATRVEENRKQVEDKKKMLKEQAELELEKATSGVSKELDPLYAERDKLYLEIEKMDDSIKAYNNAVDSQNTLMQQYITLAKKMVNLKNDLAIKLEIARTSEFKGLVTCPVCGCEFAANEDELKHFEEHKKEQVESLIKQIEEAEANRLSYKEEYDKAKTLRDEAMQAIYSAQSNLAFVISKKTELEPKIKELENKPIDTSKVHELNMKMAELDTALDVTKDYQKVSELKAKVETLKKADALKIQDEVDNINNQITELNSKISQEYVKKSKAAEKTEYEANLKAIQTKLNDSESLLARCNSLIQKMISLINQKATEKTGLTFVMLEENLSNDGIKEVCYATVDGIPFKDVNTAKKIKYGIKFIEKMKEILGHNSFPILADRLEGIDSLETIKNLTNEQLICTRVSNEEEITIC